MPHPVKDINPCCDWPGCIEPFVYCTCNCDGAYVCRKHSKITNGMDAEDQTPFLPMMQAMANIAYTRRQFDL